MIQCPKCSADNQIGAIFCRGCGEKLDLDEIKPESVQEAARAHEGKPQTNWFKLIKNIVMLIILLLTVGVLLSLFMVPPGGVPDAEVTDETLKSVQGKLDSYDARKRSLTLTMEELNAAVKIFMLTTDEELEKTKLDYEQKGQSGLILTECYVEVVEAGEENRVRILIREQHTSQGWLGFWRSIEGKVVVGETGLTLDLTDAKMFLGKVPMHRFGNKAKANTLAHFITAKSGKGPLNKSLMATKRIKIEADKVKFRK